MGELKSAWEIAQGKADRLGKLSAEELQQQREEKCRQTGQAIALRYLENIEPLELDVELEKHPEEEKGLIKRAAAKRLLEALELGSQSGTGRRPAGGDGGMDRVIQGIARLEPKSGAIIEQLRQLFQEYEAATGQTGREIESKGRERLHRLRISGTAAGAINMEAMPEWQQAWQRLKQPFQPRLDQLKQELTKLL